METSQVAHAEYRDNIQAYRDVMWKAKAHLESNLSDGMKCNKIKECIICKRKMWVCLNICGRPGDGDTEKGEVVNAAFALTSLVRFAVRNPKP